MTFEIIPKPILIKYLIDFEDFKEAFDDDFTESELIKAFESDKIREILESKLGFNEYVIDDIRSVIGSYIQDFKEELD
jgi:hypothetical protein